jgi:hypothetical protein
MKRLTIEKVRIFVENRGFILLSKTYTNNRIKLSMLCDKKHSCSITYRDFEQGHGCSKYGGSERKTTKEIKKFIKIKGYRLRESKWEYINSHAKIPLLCPEEHSCDLPYYTFREGHGCIECAVFKRIKTNLDKYGVEHSSQNEEIKAKRKETCLKRHGVESPTQNLTIALKAARSSNNSYIRYHWKTNEELVCQGGWEAKVVDYINANKIDFEWQPKTFKMPNGKTYRPDLYLVEQDVWVEIKGWMRGDAQAKWDWFKSEHPTAELWDKKKLRSMGIKLKAIIK